MYISLNVKENNEKIKTTKVLGIFKSLYYDVDYNEAVLTLKGLEDFYFNMTYNEYLEFEDSIEKCIASGTVNLYVITKTAFMENEDEDDDDDEDEDDNDNYNNKYSLF